MCAFADVLLDMVHLEEDESPFVGLLQVEAG
jgi:hypothetical protein